MKKILYNLLIFTFLVKIIDFTLYQGFKYLEETNVAPCNDIGSLKKLFYGSNDAAICFFGSSRTRLSVDPEIVINNTGYSAWNYAMEGSNFDQHLFTLERFLENNEAPKLVFFESEFLSLDTNNLVRRYFQTELFKPFRQYSHQVDSFFIETESFNDKIKLRLLKTYTYKNQISQLISYFFRNLTNSPKNMSNRLILPSQFLFSYGATLVPSEMEASSVNSLDLEPSISRQEAFKKLKKIAETNNVKIVLFSPPFYKGLLKDEDNCYANNFFSTLANLSSNLIFLDYSLFTQLTEDNKFWSDEFHLNEKGAILFSQELCGDINEILHPNNRTNEK